MSKQNDKDISTVSPMKGGRRPTGNGETNQVILGKAQNRGRRAISAWRGCLDAQS